MLVRTVATVILLSALSLVPAPARGRKLTAEMMAPLVAARMACDNADDLTRTNMQSVAIQFSQICRQLKRFPRVQTEYINARDSMLHTIDANPYSQNPVLAKEIESLPAETLGTKASIAILPDGDLTDCKATFLSDSPDPSWLAYPGSIGVLHNQNDMFIVWAAGIDGKPLHDKEGKVLLVVAHPFER